MYLREKSPNTEFHGSVSWFEVSSIQSEYRKIRNRKKFMQWTWKPLKLRKQEISFKMETNEKVKILLIS